VSAERTEPEELSKIAQQHQELRDTLKQVAETTSLERLVSLLEKLREQLREHFADEEGEEGLEQAIGESAPRHLRALEALFDEHREFLEVVGGMIERCQALLMGPKAEILRDVQTLTERLHQHEARETDLLTDSVYTDVGTGD
jgi:DNA mismatch repair ATPase MutS